MTYDPVDGNGRQAVLIQGEDDRFSATARQMAVLAGVGIRNINIHIASIYEAGELTLTATGKPHFLVAAESGRDVRCGLDDAAISELMLAVRSAAEVRWSATMLQYGEGDFAATVTEDAHGMLWATARQIAAVFGTTVRYVEMHIAAIYAEGILDLITNSRPHVVVVIESGREVQRTLTLYNFKIISAVGDRVSSLRGTMFRLWRSNLVMERLKAERDAARLDAGRLEASLRLEHDGAKSVRDGMAEVRGLLDRHAHDLAELELFRKEAARRAPAGAAAPFPSRLAGFGGVDGRYTICPAAGNAMPYDSVTARSNGVIGDGR